MHPSCVSDGEPDKSSPKHLLLELESQKAIKESEVLSGPDKQSLLADSFTRAFQKRNGFSLTPEEANNFRTHIFDKKNNRYSWNDIKIAFYFFDRDPDTKQVTPQITFSNPQKIEKKVLGIAFILSAALTFLSFVSVLGLTFMQDKHTLVMLLITLTFLGLTAFTMLSLRPHLRAKSIQSFLLRDASHPPKKD